MIPERKFLQGMGKRKMTDIMEEGSTEEGFYTFQG
jgi:hypothetical protein